MAKKMTWRVLPDRGDGHTYYGVTGMVDGEVEHHVQISDEALVNRKQLYGLTDDAEGVKHTLWANYLELNPNAPESDLPVDVKAKFDSVWGPGHKMLRGLPMTPQEELQQGKRFDAIRKPPRRLPRPQGGNHG